MVVLGAMRTRTGELGFAERMGNALSSESSHAKLLKLEGGPMSTTIELALSGRCLNHAVANVPVKHEFGKP